MHAVVDFAGGLRHISLRGDQITLTNSPVDAAINSLIISLPLLLSGFFILWKVDIPDNFVKRKQTSILSVGQ